jgi:spore maturation protein CgeB
MRELALRRHQVLFLERDVPWYAGNRDLPRPPYARTELYSSLAELKGRFAADIRAADAVIVGSYVPEGTAVGEWVTSVACGATIFYDLDTPLTISKLEKDEADYISRSLVPRYSLYLSFTGGSILEQLQAQFGAPQVDVLYCSADPELYRPLPDCKKKWDLGYLGTFSRDRQPCLAGLLIEPACRWNRGKMVVAGPQYPDSIKWPVNVQRIEHLSPQEHCAFYNSQRFTLNITRSAMIRAGYSPSVRLFEAAACGTPIISDYWNGLETLFQPGKEILVARSPEEVLDYLRELPESLRLKIGEQGRTRFLAAHTSAHRARALERHVLELLRIRPRPEERPVANGTGFRLQSENEEPAPV